MGRAPWGVDVTGRDRAISLHQRHMLITGLSDNGKTAAMRALALWVARDPGADLWIADLKGPAGWAMFDGIADRLVIGPTDEHVIAATEMLEDAVVEMQRRFQVGGSHRPLFVVVDEAQVAYMCPAKDPAKRPFGGQSNDARYLGAVRKIHNQGRAVDVTLWEATQDPTNQNLPVLSREGNHVRASLVVGTEAQAKMALGEAAVAGGAAPQELRRGLDKGALVVAGSGLEMEPWEVAVTVRTHYIDDATATQIAKRALIARQKAQQASTPTADPVDDLAAILAALRGEERVRTTAVLARLVADRPDRYRPWTAATLTAVLTAAGAPPRKRSTMKVSRTDLLAAIVARDAHQTGAMAGGPIRG
ncbi:hypothetical protein Ae168Ps1_6381 [Pseudonocardia sp. Ae168_Ps1]|uniref:hypothetical protein n=1 Tax=Pseudonocardia sp. Ae150A_Ps1 TaxID=1885028 RepID=UPI00094ACE71|nr:hypothetical protein [Pseudonocardia sp. Ae150A_Ps1]OLL69824.1 hypothetical protein Ae150APs1_6235 [Pseudonocardia sp. Ae150A_Ps1]OLL69956.1 hypothetical protein Ae168Ps1_6381 [Pseudonocardia sp. Ae168_Ps1]OLL89117.1 hypothetical protein Ae356Ps1_6234 [Pseudonocardia sp. Ae356_Ps1]